MEYSKYKRSYIIMVGFMAFAGMVALFTITPKGF